MLEKVTNGVIHGNIVYFFLPEVNRVTNQKICYVFYGNPFISSLYTKTYKKVYCYLLYNNQQKPFNVTIHTELYKKVMNILFDFHLPRFIM